MNNSLNGGRGKGVNLLQVSYCVLALDTAT